MPLCVLAFQKLKNKKDFGSQNWLFSQACPRCIDYLLVASAAGHHAEAERGPLAAVQTFSSVLEGFQNTSRFRDKNGLRIHQKSLRPRRRIVN
jgi:hypothetical protein